MAEMFCVRRVLRAGISQHRNLAGSARGKRCATAVDRFVRIRQHLGRSAPML